MHDRPHQLWAAAFVALGLFPLQAQHIRAQSLLLGRNFRRIQLQDFLAFKVIELIVGFNGLFSGPPEYLEGRICVAVVVEIEVRTFGRGLREV